MATARGQGVDLSAPFEALYKDLLRLLTWKTGNADFAHELAQETYLRLVSARDTGRVVDNPRAYILRVATNLAVDRMRSEARLRARRECEDRLSTAPDPSALPDEVLIHRERLRELDKALRQLPEKPRLALLLNRVEGLPQAEIARRLGVSESMVVKYIAQALRHCHAWRREADGRN